MSVNCYECGKKLGITEPFPGRHGAIVNAAIVLDIKYAYDRKDCYGLHFDVANRRLPLCFGCMEEKLPGSHDGLGAVYRALEAEAVYNRMKSNNPFDAGEEDDDETPDDIKQERAMALSIYQRAADERRAALPKACNLLSRECFACKGDLLPQEPYFIARPLDVSAVSPTSIDGSYSAFNVKTTGPPVSLCRDDFMKFPRAFESLSAPEKDGDDLPGTMSLFLTPEFVAAVEARTGMPFAEHLRRVLFAGVQQ